MNTTAIAHTVELVMALGLLLMLFMGKELIVINQELLIILAFLTTFVAFKKYLGHIVIDELQSRSDALLKAYLDARQKAMQLLVLRANLLQKKYVLFFAMAEFYSATAQMVDGIIRRGKRVALLTHHFLILNILSQKRLLLASTARKLAMSMVPRVSPGELKTIIGDANILPNNTPKQAVSPTPEPKQPKKRGRPKKA